MKKFFMDSMGYIIALLVVAFYFFLSYFSIQDWKIDVQAITEGALLYACSIIMSNALLKQGIQNGRNSKTYQETLSAHLIKKQKIIPQIKYLQPWLDKDYYKLLKIGRSVFVNSAGFDYEELFDDSGKFISDFKIEKPKFKTEKSERIKFRLIKKFFWFCFGTEMKVYRERRKFIKLAKKYDVTRLTISNVLNIEQNKDPNDFGETVSQYEKKKTGINAFTKVVFSVFIPPISFVFYGFSLESLIGQLIGVFFALISSLLAMFSAYVFMVRDHRNSIQMIINKLEEFENADLEEFKRGGKESVGLYTAEPVCSESRVVEEVHELVDVGSENDLRCD